MRSAILAASLAIAAAPATAQVEGNAAKRQLFSARGVQLALSRSLSEQEQEIVQGIVREADRTGQTLPYYGSIAFSPSEGLTAELISGGVQSSLHASRRQGFGGRLQRGAKGWLFPVPGSSTHPSTGL